MKYVIWMKYNPFKKESGVITGKIVINSANTELLFLSDKGNYYMDRLLGNNKHQKQVIEELNLKNGDVIHMQFEVAGVLKNHVELTDITKEHTIFK